MALSQDDIQRIVNFGGIKINPHTGAYGSCYVSRKGL
jgi:hypothetical protein